ncbi:fasciclin domain-containing protein [Actinokineospora fastidiosa]|uniref:Fasciclin n=1 Tax=Actinokineospora fastidiosa TaxID=1816 RepID=A0A918G6K4_9PSEU|nr:fasciclin domain-containing protein [Actinokineospora fastidiosa]GGS22155.1 fasciclin [Actinokineospora fastidiosa]
MNTKLVPALAAVAAAAFALSACSNSEEPSTGGDAAAPTTTTMAAPMTTTEAMAQGVTTPDDTFGPACSQLPAEGEPGSLDAMGPQPVATAASTNPLLTKLVAAVGAVDGLADTLNSAEALTVFAPADPAFAALGDAKFQELAGKPDQLAPILQFHVVPQRYDAEGLREAGTVQSLNDSAPALKIEGEGDTMTVNGAKVLCGNIPTANATVFVIDTVMTPPAA